MEISLARFVRRIEDFKNILSLSAQTLGTPMDWLPPRRSMVKMIQIVIRLTLNETGGAITHLIHHFSPYEHPEAIQEDIGTMGPSIRGNP